MSKWIAEFDLEDGDTLPEHMDLEYKGAKLDFHCRPMWIPVSERLPNEFADVLCNTDSEEIFIATYLGKMNDGIDCFDDDNGMMWEGDIIAWAPLPGQYKAESEEENE